MFTNPFNKKYQTGGSAPTDDQKKEMQGFVTWIKSNVEGFKDKSEQEIAKSLSDMAKSDEGKKSVQDLYSRYQKSKKQKSKFEDGGKFQDFICKHARGGSVDCGCGGMVIRGAEGIDDVPTPKDSTVTNNGYVIYKPSVKEVAPNGESVVITYGHDPNGQWARRMEWANGGTSILGGYNNNGQWVSEGDVTYGPTSEFAKAFLSPKARMSRYEDRPQSKQEGGELTRKQARILSEHNKGFNRGQFQLAMANADAALRANTDLRGRELRQAKRRMVAGITPIERTVAMESAPAEVAVSLPTTETISNLNPNLELPVREVKINTPVKVNRPVRRTNATTTKTIVPQNTSESDIYPIVEISNPDWISEKEANIIRPIVSTPNVENRPLHSTPRPEDTVMYPATPGAWTTMTPRERMWQDFGKYPLEGAAEWGEGGIYETDDEGNRIIKDEGNGVYWTRDAEGRLQKHEPVRTATIATSAPRRNYSAITGQPLRTGQSTWNLFKQGGQIEKAQGGKQILGPNGKPVPKIPFVTSNGTIVDPKNIESLAKFYNTPFIRRDFNNPAGYAVERIITVHPNGQRDTTGIYNPANLSSVELEQMRRGEDVKKQALRQHFNKPGVYRAKK